MQQEIHDVLVGDTPQDATPPKPARRKRKLDEVELPSLEEVVLIGYGTVGGFVGIRWHPLASVRMLAS